MSARTTLVTGAGRGAGRGIANALAAEGDNIAICDLDPDRLAKAADTLRETGANVLAMLCDVSDEEQVDEMFARVVREFGTLDILVNTVAWIDPAGPIVDMPADVWHMSVKTNLDSVFYCTRAAMKIMIPKRGGVIVNISSVNGTRGFPERASYGATKAAIINFTQTTAMEGRQYGIRANVLVPAGIQGERVNMVMAAFERRARETGVPAKQVDTDRFLTEEWIGRYVSFLVSDEGRHINGQALVIGEGGRSPLQALFPDI